MYYRLRVDVAHQYAVEQGVVKSRYAQDFRDSKACYANTWREPTTGLVMLNPSFRSRDFGDDFKGLGNWRRDTSVVEFWKQIARSADSIAMFTSTRPAGQTTYVHPLSVVAKIAEVNAGTLLYDKLEWALESNFTLNIDEGFAIHYRGLTDELLRKNNWFAVQWDDIYIHLSHRGRVTVLQYADRGHLDDDPFIVHEFDIGEPGSFIGKSGAFAFIPLPGYGLAMVHTEGGATMSSTVANTAFYSVRSSHIIPWQPRYIGSHYRLFESSPVRIALNPFHANAIGFQNITYPASGTYVEEKFDPGYKPASSVDDVVGLGLEHFGGQFGSVTATLRNADNSGNWTAGTDRQGRISFALTTSDSRYSPIVYGWGAQWLPVYGEPRDPGEVMIFQDGYDSETGLPRDVLRYLELVRDSEGRFEGVARIHARTPELIQKLERGDATYQVEYNDGDPEEEEDWHVYNGGILKVERPLEMEYISAASGFIWHAEVNLHGQEERFDEIVHTVGTAFDNLTVAEAMNLCLTTSGFSAIPEEDLPGPATNRRLPIFTKGTNFRLVPQPGDRLKKIVRDLLLMVRAQWVEVKLEYDWEEAVWTLLQRDRNPSEGWTLTYDETLEDHENKIAIYQSLKLLPRPPECNRLQVLGMSTNDNNDAEIVPSSPIRNEASLTDPESVDYAGRIKSAYPVAPGLTNIHELNRMARTIETRAMHRNLEWTVGMPPSHFNLALIPDRHITLLLPPIRGQEEDGDREFEAWIKKTVLVVDADRHTAVNGDAGEALTLYLDETWENPFRAEAE